MSTLSAGDTAFMLVSTALVFLMTPGLAFFYGGMVRKRHVLSIMIQSFAAVAIVTVLWTLYGYSLAFGADHGHLIGGFAWFGLRGVGLEPNPDYSATIPHLVFYAFQLMFAIITPALMTGSTAERLRFPAYFLLVVLWSSLVYVPLAHWVWGVGGWLRNLGVLDFAGGTVVHISSGVSALVAAQVIGKRFRRKNEVSVPHHLPLVLLGGGLLWFGWFGFNAGSALAANGLAALAFATTQAGASTGMLGWLFVEWVHRGKPTVLGAVSGAVAGLVAITPAAGFVSVASALLIGFIAGGICYYSVSIMKGKLGYDDALDAFGVHGIGGTWGALATGLFATTAVNPNGADGLLAGGGFHLVLMQLIAIAATYAFASSITWIILKFISLFMPLQASEEEQEYGLDLTQHGENAYPDFDLGNDLQASWNMTD